MDEKILTQHPEGKKGVNISRAKYEVMKSAILTVLSTTSEVSLKDLTAQVKKDLVGRFEGSVGWYLISVKQDLESKKVIEIIPNKKPQHLRIIK